MTSAGPRQGPRPVPELRGTAVLLSPWDDADLPAIVEIAADEASRAWSASLRPVRTVEDARAWMTGRTSSPDRVDWAVRDPASRHLIGRVGLHRFAEHPVSAEIGYGVHPAHRGRGIAQDAATTAFRYAVDTLGLHRLTLVHATGNAASCAVAAASGFAFEGVERDCLDHGDGILHDAHRHARLATDPPGPADVPPPPLDVPVLDGDGIRLRPWRDDEAGTYLRGMADPAAARWNPHPAPADTDDALRLLARLRRRAREGSTVAWAVEVDGVAVGSLGLRGVNLVDRWVNAAYWVLPESRGRGVAPRALEVATAYAVDGLGLHRVQLQHAVENIASCRVAEKAGFALEGTQRGSVLLADGFVDEHLHARVAR